MNGPSHGGIAYACQQYVVPTGVPDHLLGRLGGLLSGYDSVGDFADIWRIWTVPVLSLLPAKINIILPGFLHFGFCVLGDPRRIMLYVGW